MQQVTASMTSLLGAHQPLAAGCFRTPAGNIPQIRPPATPSAMKHAPSAARLTGEAGTNLVLSKLQGWDIRAQATMPGIAYDVIADVEGAGMLHIQVKIRLRPKGRQTDRRRCHRDRTSVLGRICRIGHPILQYFRYGIATIAPHGSWDTRHDTYDQARYRGGRIASPGGAGEGREGGRADAGDLLGPRWAAPEGGGRAGGDEAAGPGGWIERYNKAGLEGLRDRPRGRSAPRAGTLTEKRPELARWFPEDKNGMPACAVPLKSNLVREWQCWSCHADGIEKYYPRLFITSHAAGTAVPIASPRYTPPTGADSGDAQTGPHVIVHGAAMGVHRLSRYLILLCRKLEAYLSRPDIRLFRYSFLQITLFPQPLLEDALD